MNDEAITVYNNMIDKQEAAKEETKHRLSLESLKERIDNLEFMFKVVAAMCIVIGATLIFMLSLLALAGA